MHNRIRSLFPIWMESEKRRRSFSTRRQDFVLLGSQGEQNATGFSADLSVNCARFGATIVAGAHNIPFDEEIALEHVDLFDVQVTGTGIDRPRIRSTGITGQGIKT